jgi:uncharacterized repeat protein (TIGR02543 family)
MYLPSFANPFDPESPVYAVHTPPTILAPAAGHEFTVGFTLVWKKAGTVADTYRLQVAAEQDFRDGSVVLDVELSDVDRYTVSSVPFHGQVYCRLALKVNQQGKTWSPWSTPLRVVKVAPEGNRAPVVSLVTSDPVAAVGGQTVTISATGSDLDGDIVVYRWYVDGVLQSCRSADFDFAVPGSATEQMYTVGVDGWDGAEANPPVYIVVEAEAGGLGSYSIGDYGPAGGIIFYDNPNYAIDGWRYLEAWVADEPGSGYQWKTTLTSTPGTSVAIGSGYTNTYTAMTGSEHPAAEVTRNANHGGYSDWFLPSKGELNLMYGQKEVIGGLESGSYWSSSGISASGVWSQDFATGQQIDFFGKDNFRRVRAVRAFSDGHSLQHYTITYNANGASSGTVPTQSANVAGTNLLVPDHGSLRGPVITDGITQRFTGWNTQPDGSGTNYQPGDSLIMPASNLTLNAQWTDDGGVIGKIGLAGGIVFYENPNHAVDGWYYMEAALEDISLSGQYHFVWGGNGTSIPGASGMAVGTGAFNTNAIVAAFGDHEPFEGRSEYAAKLCSNFTLGDYTDWFLPSLGELELLFQNLHQQFLLRFPVDSYDFYWSSSGGNGFAWGQHFSEGNQVSLTCHSICRVRPVRVFGGSGSVEHFTLSYNANGASTGTVPAQSANVAGTNLPVSDHGSLRGPVITDGITQRFTGWSTSSDGSGSSYQPADTLIMPASNLTLYAQWTGDGSVIGKVGPAGGIVFYENLNHAVDGWRYLEAWIEDEPGPYYQWKTSNTSTPGTSNIIGSGYANTYMAMVGVEHPAAEVCRNANHGGYYDWFLASKDELNLMYLRREVIGGLSSSYYWSSSEDNSYSAFGQTFVNGGQHVFLKDSGDGGDGNYIRIRVVRAFRNADQSLHMVSYNPNGADNGTVPTDGYHYVTGEAVTVSGNTGSLTKTDFVFTGWNTQPDGSGSSYAEGASFTIGINSVTLYAQWEELDPDSVMLTVAVPGEPLVTIDLDPVDISRGSTFTVTASVEGANVQFMEWYVGITHVATQMPSFTYMVPVDAPIGSVTKITVIAMTDGGAREASLYFRVVQ